MTVEQENFINRIAVPAVKDMSRSGVLASLTIAQAILESGWGKSGLTVKANALFGIKATGSVNQYWKGRVYNGKTQECYDGKNMVTITDGFRAYDNWDDSIADHSALLTGAARYNALIGEKDYIKACKAIQAANYATAPNYADTLIKCIETYNLTKYDTERKNDMGYKHHVLHTNNQLLTSGFHIPSRPNHHGADYIASNNAQNTARGVDVTAITDGIVSKVAYDSSRGNYVDIKHGNITSRYQHLRNGIKVKVGDVIKKGQVIGVMGNTGACSSSNPNVPKEYAGTHLHLEIHENGKEVDPEPYLTGAKTIGAVPATAQPPQSNTALQVGHKVRVRQGAKDHSGGNLASHVYSNVYDVHQINGDRAVIGAGGKVTAAVNVKDLQKV